MSNTDLLQECICGHPLEEHDWGAYLKPHPEWKPACLVQGCDCEEFIPKGVVTQIQDKLKANCRVVLANCPTEKDCQDRACWYWESIEIFKICRGDIA